MYPRVYYRLTTLLLLATLSSCSVYDHFFHPHRLGTPPMTASAKAKARAADKARHKGLTLGTTEATKADGADSGTSSADGAAAPAPAADTRSADDKNKAIAEMLGNTYDKKTGLLKRSKLQRLDYSAHALHHYDLRPTAHSKATRDERKLRKYRKHPKSPENTPTDEPAARASKPAPAPDPTQPALKTATATPRPATAPEPPTTSPAADAADEPPVLPARSKPGKFQTEKKSKKKDRKAPRPDPTQPYDGN